MEMNDNKDKHHDKYQDLSDKSKNLVEMYITARQFKNAVLEEEVIILPAKQNNQEENTVLNWGGTKITFRGDKKYIKVYPFIVNKSFACEVYLKLLLTDVDFNFKSLKGNERHGLFKLYENMDDEFKNSLFALFIKTYGDEADQQFIEKEILNISNVFIEWRYIYEKCGEEIKVNYGFLNAFCDFLDRYAQKMFITKYNYNVDENMR